MTTKTNDMTQVHSVLYGRRWQNFLKSLPSTSKVGR